MGARCPRLGAQGSICCCRVCRKNTGQERAQRLAESARATRAPAVPRDLCATVTAGRGDTTPTIKLGERAADPSPQLSKLPRSRSLRPGAAPHLVTPGEPQGGETRRCRWTREAWGAEGVAAGPDQLGEARTDRRPARSGHEVLTSHLVSLLPRRHHSDQKLPRGSEASWGAACLGDNAGPARPGGWRLEPPQGPLTEGLRAQQELRGGVVRAPGCWPHSLQGRPAQLTWTTTRSGRRKAPGAGRRPQGSLPTPGSVSAVP